MPDYIDFAVNKICMRSTNEIPRSSYDTSTFTSFNEPSCPILIPSKDSMLSTDEKCVENVQLISTANHQVLPTSLFKLNNIHFNTTRIISYLSPMLT